MQRQEYIEQMWSFPQMYRHELKNTRYTVAPLVKRTFDKRLESQKSPDFPKPMGHRMHTAQLKQTPCQGCEVPEFSRTGNVLLMLMLGNTEYIVEDGT